MGPKNIPKTTSQEVFGCQGYMISYIVIIYIPVDSLCPFRDGEKTRDPKSVGKKTLDLQLKRTLQLKIDASKIQRRSGVLFGVFKGLLPRGIWRLPFVSGSVSIFGDWILCMPRQKEVRFSHRRGILSHVARPPTSCKF